MAKKKIVATLGPYAQIISGIGILALIPIATVQNIPLQLSGLVAGTLGTVVIAINFIDGLRRAKLMGSEKKLNV